MPRDFVPCVYREWLSEDGQDKRCQVIECFEGVHIASRDLEFTMSLDSHAHHMDTAADDDRARWDVFEQFYAAMAALE